MTKQPLRHVEAIKPLTLETEITLETVIDQSSKLKQALKIPTVVTAILNYDVSNAQYFIHNPLDTSELIFVNKTIVAINESAIGSEVLVSFDDNDVYKPVITGVIQPLKKPHQNSSTQIDNFNHFESSIDGNERLVFNAKHEIVLQCGKSSIHLTKAGKVIIRGNYVLSRSSGLNSLKGGAISIN